MAMAEITLLPAVRETADDTPILANGFSCRHQIAHGSGRKSIHIATLLRAALANQSFFIALGSPSRSNSV